MLLDRRQRNMSHISLIIFPAKKRLCVWRQKPFILLLYISTYLFFIIRLVKKCKRDIYLTINNIFIKATTTSYVFPVWRVGPGTWDPSKGLPHHMFFMLIFSKICYPIFKFKRLLGVLPGKKLSVFLTSLQNKKKENNFYRFRGHLPVTRDVSLVVRGALTCLF